MKYFTITDYDFNPPRVFQADTLIINDRRIYAEDYDEDEEMEMRVDGAVLMVKIGNKFGIRSTNWTTLKFADMEDTSDYKDFARL